MHWHNRGFFLQSGMVVRTYFSQTSKCLVRNRCVTCKLTWTLSVAARAFLQEEVEKGLSPTCLVTLSLPLAFQFLAP
jgi:hypothetical protein